MAITVRIPTVLRPATGGQAVIEGEGTTIGAVLGRIATDHPGVKPQLFHDDGALHKFLNVYINDDDVRYLGGLEAPVADGDEITLLPAVAGGAV
ncbi:MAG: MoaD/ThiS family protein [Acidobacteria bacterium]|nr:MoaD/ThiS family protein [Acidobacteriota bacterium]